MNILPSLEEVKQIAATGEYNVLPVSCEILSDRRTPIETLRVLKTVSSHCYMVGVRGGAGEVGPVYVPGL